MADDGFPGEPFNGQLDAPPPGQAVPGQAVPGQPPPVPGQPFTGQLDPPNRTWGQWLTDQGQNLATGILKGGGQLAGLPHTIAGAADAAFDLFGNPRSAIAGNTNPLGEPGPAPAKTTANIPPMMPPGPGFLTGHTYSPEEINKGIFSGVSALNQATGGKPVEPYMPKSAGERVVQAGAEQVIPSLVGPAEGLLSRAAAGAAGGSASQAYAEARPDDKLGQLVAGLLATPAAALSIGGATNFGRAFGNTMVGRYGSPENQALYRIGRNLNEDITAGGPSPTDISRGMWDAGSTPLTPADTAGENTTKFLGQAARLPGPGRQFATDFLNTRDAGAGGRLSALADSLVPGSSTYRTGEALADAADKAATPAYDAFRAYRPMSPDAVGDGGDLNKLFQRPTIQAGLKGALKNVADEGGDPSSLGITFDADGNVKFQGVPSWKTMELVKRGIDEDLNQYRDQYGRWIGGAPGARSALQAQKDFVGFMDDNNALYQPARDAFAGPAASGTALKMGQAAMKGGEGAPGVEEIADDLSKMSPGDQAFYRLAARNQLKAEMSRMGQNADESRAFIGSPDRQARIKTIFGSDADAFLNAGSAENTGFGTRYDVLGNSKTAGRFAQDLPLPGETFMQKLAPFGLAAGSAFSGEPALALTQLARGVGGILGGGGLSPEVAQHVARNLLETNPTTAHQTLSEALARYRGPEPTTAGKLIPGVPMVSGLLGQTPPMSYAWKGPPGQ